MSCTNFDEKIKANQPLTFTKNQLLKTHTYMKINFPRIILTCTLIVMSFANASAQNNDAATEAKIDQLVKKMTLEEKISMLHANSIFTTSGVARLGIPGLSTNDGPLECHNQ